MVDKRPPVPAEYNYGYVRRKSAEKVKDIFTELADELAERGPESMLRQLRNYAEGRRGTEISDGTCVTFSKIRMAVEEQERIYELDRAGFKLPRD